jgi:hypothetical protein
VQIRLRGEAAVMAAAELGGELGAWDAAAIRRALGEFAAVNTATLVGVLRREGLAINVVQAAIGVSHALEGRAAPVGLRQRRVFFIGAVIATEEELRLSGSQIWMAIRNWRMVNGLTR